MQKLDKAKPRLRAGSWKVSLEETPNQSLYYLSSSPTFLVSGMPLVSAASVSHRGTCNALGIQPTFATAQRATAQDGGGVCVYAPPQPATRSQPKTLSVITADRTGKSGDTQSDHQIPLLSSCLPPPPRFAQNACKNQGSKHRRTFLHPSCPSAL